MWLLHRVVLRVLMLDRCRVGLARCRFWGLLWHGWHTLWKREECGFCVFWEGCYFKLKPAWRTGSSFRVTCCLWWELCSCSLASLTVVWRCKADYINMCYVLYHWIKNLKTGQNKISEGVNLCSRKLWLLFLIIYFIFLDPTFNTENNLQMNG